MKALVMCSKKSNPDIILIIFFLHFFYFVYNQRIITKMQNSYQSEQEQNTKVSNNS